MIKTTLNRLKSQKGESLAETLVAVLIGGVSLLIFSSMLFSSKNIILKGDDYINEFYEQRNIVETRSGSPSSGVITISDRDGTRTSINVNMYKMYEGTENEITSYE